METKFYVDKNGNYLGGFAGVEPPKGSVEVPSAPDNASDKWVNGAWVKNVDEVVKLYEAETQSRLESFAQLGGYGSVLSCVSYANSTNPKFKADALKMIKLRDETWAKAYEIMQDVQNGEITLPSLDEYLSMLPVLTWD